MKRLTRTVVLLAAACMAPLAAAQSGSYVNPYNMSRWNNPVSASCDLLISQSIQRSMLRKSIENKYGKNYATSSSSPPSAQPAAKPPKPKFSLAKTDFKKGPAWLMPKAFAKSIPGTSAEDQKSLSATFTQILNGVLKETKRANLAYGMAVMIGGCIQLAYGIELADADAEHLIRLFNDALAANPAIKKMPAKQKQQAYESMVLTFGLFQLLAEVAKSENDQEMGNTIKLLAKGVVEDFTKR